MSGRVVVEYEFRGYTPPEFLEADAVPCRVTHALGALNLAGSLFDVRESLEALGFELHGAAPAKQHNGGRYCPTWREVWTAAQRVA